MEKINIAELLKDCPKGMELDCTLYDNCTFEGIEDLGYIDILVKTPSGRIRLTKEGCYIRHDDYAKCVIFPKGKTTWEGFVSPYKFKDGDIVCTTLNSIAIIKEESDACYTVYCGVTEHNVLYFQTTVTPMRFATEKEKQKLFQAIEDNGYKWNAETKTLEKLIKPKFKIGDKITNDKIFIVISYIDDEYYYEIGRNIANRVYIKNQDEWKLVSNKFDINTLKHFDKVLVRNCNTNKWDIDFFGYYFKGYYYTTGSRSYRQCIPYKGNEYMVGTSLDCAEYYKTWRVNYDA